jgi:hypothetical protein
MVKMVTTNNEIEEGIKAQKAVPCRRANYLPISGRLVI